MINDKIAEIRKQHTEVEVALRGGRPDDAPEWAMDAHDHRGILLAEVERLRGALQKIRAVATDGGALDSRYRAIAENALGDADNVRRQR